MNQPPLRQRIDASGGSSRAISTGRIRRAPSVTSSNTSSSRGRLDREQAQSVTKAILDLREKREQSQSRRLQRETLKKHPLQQQHQQQKQQHTRSQSLVEIHSSKQQQQQSQPLHSRSLPVADSKSEADEHQAANRLKQAETKISSLAMELEELRFFSEIEAASPSPTSKDSRPLQPLGLSTSYSGSPPDQPHPTRDRYPEPRMRTLSPRKLSAMDRVSLELEAQQLQRQVDILMQEKSTLEATVAMNKGQLESHDEDTKRIQILEKALKNVQKELSHQLEELQTGRKKLVQEYEGKLDIMQREYQTTRDTANELLESLQETQEALELLQKRHVASKEESRKKLDDMKVSNKEREEAWAKEKSLFNVKIDTMTQTLADYEESVSKLQKQLEESQETLETTKREKDDSYELRIEVLTQQLSLVKDQYDSLRSDNEQQQQILQERDGLLLSARETEESQKSRMAEMQSQLDEMQSKHEKELQQLKEREKRRLNDMVAQQQDSNAEYERRLKALQEQLSHATDRHQSEMEHKEKAMKSQMEAEVESEKQKVVVEYEQKLKAAQEETALVQVKYEEAKEENLRRQVQAESRDRDAARDWERKDALRQGELDRMNDKLDRTSRSLAEKEDKIQSLQEKLSEIEDRHKNMISEIESQHAEELAAREELLASQRKSLKANESKLRTELTRRESDLTDLRDALESENAQLRDEVESLRRSLDNAARGSRSEEQLKQRLADTQSSMDKLENDFVAEKARHDSIETEMRVEIAKLEGKLAATESTLKEKRGLVEDLESRLMNVDEKTSTDLSNYQNQIGALRRDLDSARDLLQQEQSTAEEKDVIIEELQRRRKEDQVQLQKIGSLEQAIARLEGALDQAERENSAHIENIEKLQDNLKRAEDEAQDYKKRLVEDMGHQDAMSDLERKLRDETSKKTELQSQVEELGSKLEQAESASKSRSADSDSLKQRIAELEDEIEHHKKTASRSTTASNSSVQELRRQLKAAELAQEQVAVKLDGLITEKAEVVEALEQVIGEVQSREDEIEALTSILRKRDEELEHAKLIATKAIASAQEIKTRYKEKGAMQSDLKDQYREQIDELNESLVYVTEKHDLLKQKTQRLEADLRNKAMECARLKDLLNDAAAQGATRDPPSSKSSQGFLPMDNGNASNGTKKGIQLMEKGFEPFEEDSQSASQADSSAMIDTSMSTATADLGEATKWLADFDTNDDDCKKQPNNEGFEPLGDDAQSEPGLSQSRRSIERDALRKYVRKRYLKRNAVNQKLSEC
jgi:hypothetical protein